MEKNKYINNNINNRALEALRDIRDTRSVQILSGGKKWGINIFMW
jgi:hypothetical protein